MKPSQKIKVFFFIIVGCILFNSDVLSQEYLSYLQEGALEWEENRTEYSKTFINLDGTNTAVISISPVHFLDEFGEWSEIKEKTEIQIPIEMFDGIMICKDDPEKTSPGVGYKGLNGYCKVRSYIEWSTESIDDDATINSAQFTLKITNGNTTQKSFGWYKTPQIEDESEFVDVSNSWSSANRYCEFIESSEESWTQIFQCDDFKSDIESKLSAGYISAGFMNNNETITSKYLSFKDVNGGENPKLIVNYTLPNYIPPILYLQNMIINENESLFEAIDQIFAGNTVTFPPYGDVIVTRNASVTFRAGERIFIKPGFHVYEGAYFYANIEPYDQVYESNSTLIIPSLVNNIQQTEDFVSKDTFLESSISIYPNPNTGVFNISFSNIPEELITVEVRNMMGAIVFNKVLNGESSCHVDISNYPIGLYCVYTKNDHKQLLLEKIIKIQ